MNKELKELKDDMTAIGLTVAQMIAAMALKYGPEYALKFAAWIYKPNPSFDETKAILEEAIARTTRPYEEMVPETELTPEALENGK